ARSARTPGGAVSGSGRSIAVTLVIRSSRGRRIGDESGRAGQTRGGTAPNTRHEPEWEGSRRGRRGAGRGYRGGRGAARGRADGGQRVTRGGGRRAPDRLHAAVAEELRHRRVRLP